MKRRPGAVNGSSAYVFSVTIPHSKLLPKIEKRIFLDKVRMELLSIQFEISHNVVFDTHLFVKILDSTEFGTPIMKSRDLFYKSAQVNAVDYLFLYKINLLFCLVQACSLIFTFQLRHK